MTTKLPESFWNSLRQPTIDNFEIYKKHIAATFDYYQSLSEDDWSIIVSYKAPGMGGFSRTTYHFFTGQLHKLYIRDISSRESTFNTMVGQIKRLVEIIYNAPKLPEDLIVYSGQNKNLYSPTNGVNTSYSIISTSVIPQVSVPHYINEKVHCCLYQITISKDMPCLFYLKDSKDDIQKFKKTMSKNKASISTKFKEFIDTFEVEIILPPHIKLSISEQKNVSYNLSKIRLDDIRLYVNNISDIFDDTELYNSSDLRMLSYIRTKYVGTPDLAIFNHYIDKYASYLLFLMKYVDNKSSTNNEILNDMIKVLSNDSSNIHIDHRYHKGEPIFSMLHFIRNILKTPQCNHLRKNYDIVS